MREAFDCGDQSRDAHRRLLNLGRETCEPNSKAADHRSTAASAGPSTAAAIRSSASNVTAVSASGWAMATSTPWRASHVVDRLLAFRLLDRRRHAVSRRREARGLDAVNRGQLCVGQPCRPQRARRPLGLLEMVLEQRRAALDRRGRVVQLMRQSRGQFPEGGHFFVLQVARGEDSGAIDHRVDEGGGHPLAFADHRGEMVAMNRKDDRRLLGPGIARRADHARIRQDPVTSPSRHSMIV